MPGRGPSSALTVGLAAGLVPTPAPCHSSHPVLCPFTFRAPRAQGTEELPNLTALRRQTASPRPGRSRSLSRAQLAPAAVLLPGTPPPEVPSQGKAGGPRWDLAGERLELRSPLVPIHTPPHVHTHHTYPTCTHASHTCASSHMCTHTHTLTHTHLRCPGPPGLLQVTRLARVSSPPPASNPLAIRAWSRVGTGAVKAHRPAEKFPLQLRGSGLSSPEGPLPCCPLDSPASEEAVTAGLGGPGGCLTSPSLEQLGWINGEKTCRLRLLQKRRREAVDTPTLASPWEGGEQSEAGGLQRRAGRSQPSTPSRERAGSSPDNTYF